MKAYQRIIRETMALTPEPDEEEKREAAASFQNASVREISYAEASTIILRYEWLQNMGSAAHCFGLFFRHPVTEVEYLAGACCFGSTGGTESHASVLGKEYAHLHLVRTLTRGACVHWADCDRISSDGRVHTGAAGSYLISHACKLMAERGVHAFVAFCDGAAGEVGCVYQSANWAFGGYTAPTEEFRWTGEPVKDDLGRDWKDGNWHNARLVHGYTRNRTNRKLLRALKHHGFAEDQGRTICGSWRHPYLQKLSRKEQREQMIAEGFEFRKGRPKGRYVYFAGDRRIVRQLRKALRWAVEPYPKRTPSSEDRVQVANLNPVPKTFAAHAN
jgi:hypothetical protein